MSDVGVYLFNSPGSPLVHYVSHGFFIDKRSGLLARPVQDLDSSTTNVVLDAVCCLALSC